MPSYLITGASRGLGYAWLVYLSCNPSNTILGLVRNKPATEARLAKDSVKNVHLLSTAVTDLPAIQAAGSEAANSPAESSTAFLTVAELKPQVLAKELNLSWEANVIGTVYVLDSILPLIRKGELKKVNVTNTGMADWDMVHQYSLGVATPYSVSKAAAVMLVSNYHAALGESEGILFFLMRPGFVDTREEKPYTEEDIQGQQAMGARFATYAPDFKGPITREESVEAQLKLIERATVNHFGGAFVSHFRNKQWL